MRHARRRTVLLMWEYGCEHSPVWSRSDDLDVGPVDVADLGIGDPLREDLAAWNRAMELAADPDDQCVDDPVPLAWWRAREGEAFDLAIRLQEALPPGWTVWCAAGGGDGMLDEEGLGLFRATDGRAQLLLHDDALTLLAPGADGLPPLVPDAVRAAVRQWVALGRRRAQPGFDGPGAVDPDGHRLHGLRIARRLAARVPDARILWFGGDERPTQ